MNIWVNGCFDILHTGHIDLLWYAKRFNPQLELFPMPLITHHKLIVGLDSDERVKQLKGNNRPINDINTRITIMKNLKMVDDTVVFNTDDELRNFIKVFNIDYVIVGDHYRNKEVIGAENAKYGAAFYSTDERSTTNIIQKIQNENNKIINVVGFNINYNDENIKFLAYNYDIMTNKMMFNTHTATPKFYELEVLEFIGEKNNKGGVALDIGANIGNHSLYFSKFIFDKTYAFEAHPQNYQLLLENKKNNNIDDDKLIIHNCALSDGYYNYKIMENSLNMGGCRVIEMEDDGDIVTKKLDDFELPKINFIKLDVEGHELKILKGGINLIKRDFPDIIVENESEKEREMVDLFMEELGYRMIEGFRGYGMFYYKHK